MQAVDLGLLIIVAILVAAAGLVIMPTWVVKRTGSTAIAAAPLALFDRLAADLGLDPVRSCQGEVRALRPTAWSSGGPSRRWSLVGR